MNPLSILAILGAAQAKMQGSGRSTPHMLASIPNLLSSSPATNLFSLGGTSKPRRVKPSITPGFVGLLNEIRQRRQMESFPLLARANARPSRS